jgi:ADP-heptose:LPS heptosyltransferase
MDNFDVRIGNYPRMHQCDLSELAARLRGASAYLGNDGGITHLAAAVQCPTLALFGPTRPEHWAPRGLKTAWIKADGNDISAITVDQVWDALIQLISSAETTP